MKTLTLKLAVLLAGVALAACGPEPTQDPCENVVCPGGTECREGACVPTGGTGDQDAGNGNDAGADGGTDGGFDGGEIIPDGGEMDGGEMDAGEMDGGEPDAGEMDAGEPDAGEMDAGEPDAGEMADAGPSLASMQIEAVRQAATDAGLAMPIQGAVVTYVKPEVGADPEGFFLQGDQTGPAIFVEMDGGTLGMVPAVGDIVDLEVNTVEQLTSGAPQQRRVTAFSNFVKQSGGNPVSGFAQEISNAIDVVSSLDLYESELITATGTLMQNPVGAGAGHVASDLDTAGIVGNNDLELRVPTTVRDFHDITNGCSVTVTATPLWRFGSKAQVSAWVPGDISVNSCPAPKLLSAAATSATTVDLTFDRYIASASATASGFNFTGGLTASGAGAVDNVVTVQTSAQLAGTPYTVTVGTSVTDTRMTPVDATANTATFNGFAPPADIVINEVNANISGGDDLIELLVVNGGSLNGIAIEQIGTSTVVNLATLPDVIVQAGDIVVVHFSVTGGTETMSKSEIPQSMQADYYDTAWDVQGASSGMSATSSRVLRVVKPNGTTFDAVPFMAPNSTPSTQFLAEYEAITSSMLWAPACMPTPCTEADVEANGAVDWTGLSSTPAGASVAKSSSSNTNTKVDWSKTTNSSFGLANP